MKKLVLATAVLAVAAGPALAQTNNMAPRPDQPSPPVTSGKTNSSDNMKSTTGTGPAKSEAAKGATSTNNDPAAAKPGNPSKNVGN
ncbi:MAG: hypothetical protein HXY30_10460 [Pseudorhodoplanes sp.]|nr:hypothetical protein [Pseudorhodoplanes sp.]